MSIFKGLTLNEYLEVRCYICVSEHHQPCSICPSLIEVGNEISNEGYMRLSEAFAVSNPGQQYKSTHARRKLLQMPLAAVKIKADAFGGKVVYLVDKNANLTTVRGILNLLHAQQSQEKAPNLTKATVKELLQLSESDSERSRLTFAISQASGLSTTKLRNIYGFEDISNRKEKVEAALRAAQEIRESIEFLSHIKEKAVLRSFGISIESESSDQASESEESSSDPENSPSNELERENDELTVSSLWKDPSQKMSTNQDGGSHEYSLPDDPEICKQVTETGETYLNSHQLMDLLQECQLNWFCFADVLKQKLLRHQGEHLLDQVLLDFSGQIPFLNISLHDEKLIEQSHQAFLAEQRLHNLEDNYAEDEICSESDEEQGPESLTDVTDILQPAARKALQKRVRSVRRKAKREAAKKIAEKRFLKRKRSKRVGRIMKNYPDIGRKVEEFVQNNGVGADAWRRTGVFTFDGNRKLNKKVTYKRIKEHLEQTYKTSFSYGTVVQLGVARNKRRRSASNYKGLARVTCRRTRKGFTIKYNPDQHWSSAFYRGLDYIQYMDGTDKLVLNRDDQAGFRLDTLATHNKHATLCIQGNVPLATKTDFVTKYPSVLQTSSYNFTETKTATELCGGIVKAIPVHSKNPAQHASDIEFLEETDELKPAFINPTTNERKKIECIRVDGGNDEGPGHVEVQFFWTKRHLEKGSIVQLVTTRDAGSSNKNRVELQNGCLAQGHTNLFIPSTLNGSCMDSAKVNFEKLSDNLNDAIDVYISRVNGCPCGDTQIHLFKGPEDKENQKLRELFKIYIKGNDEKMQLLKNNHPVEFKLIQDVWNLRERHLVKGPPAKYVFHLVCCYKKDCIHPECKKGPPDTPPVWYQCGSSVSFLPLPVPDIERSYGIASCCECAGSCTGHYLEPTKLIEKFLKGEQNQAHPPPSEVLKQIFNDPEDNSTADQAALKTLLPHDKVTMWFQHLENVQENRKKGAQKAVETRRKNNQLSESGSSKGKKKRKKKEKVITSESQELCRTCLKEEPPCPVDNAECVDWIECGKCKTWHHQYCVVITTFTDNYDWKCPLCISEDLM